MTATPNLLAAAATSSAGDLLAPASLAAAIGGAAAVPDGGVPRTAVPDSAATSEPITLDSFALQEEDAATLTALVTEVSTRIPLQAIPSDVGGTLTPARDRIIAMLDGLVQSLGVGAVRDPVAGTRSSLTRAVRQALELSATAPVPPDWGSRVLALVTGLTDPLSLGAALLGLSQLPADTVALWRATDPDAIDDVVLATKALLERPDTPDAPRSLGTPRARVAFTPPPPAVRLGMEMLRQLKDALRLLRAETGPFQPHTSVEGQIVHQIIIMHYIAQHPGHHVITDNLAWSPQEQLLYQLASQAESNSLLASVRDALVAYWTGRVGQPDILDVATGEVYEIKPFSQAADATAQLYGRYLLPLNIKALGTEAAARALLARFLPGGGVAPAGRGWTPPSANVKFYKPGMWKPASVYPFGDGYMIAQLVVPGVIGYQIVKSGKRKVDGPSYDQLAAQLFASLSTLAVVSTATLDGAPPLWDVLSWNDSPLLPPGITSDDLLTLAKLLAVGVGAVLLLVVVVPALMIEAPAIATVWAGMQLSLQVQAQF